LIRECRGASPAFFGHPSAVRRRLAVQGFSRKIILLRGCAAFLSAIAGRRGPQEAHAPVLGIAGERDTKKNSLSSRLNHLTCF